MSANDVRAIASGPSRGRLDIHIVAAGHHGPHAITHTITTFRSWPSTLLRYRSGNGFIISFTRVHGGSNPDHYAFILYARGRLRGIITDSHYRITGMGRVTRPDEKSAEIMIPKRAIGNPSGYTFDVTSVYHRSQYCCIYTFSSGSTLLHDLTPPELLRFRAPRLASDGTWLSSTIPGSFYVRERGGSGFSSWTILARRLGASKFKPTNSSGGDYFIGWTLQYFDPHLDPGTYDVRVKAVDEQRNVRLGPIIRSTVPYDDRDLPAGSFVGEWEGGIGPGNCDYGGAVVESSVPASSFTYGFTGTGLVWMAPGGFGGVAEVSVDAGAPIQVNLGTLAHTACRAHAWTASGLDGGPHTVTISVVSGTVPIDAIAVLP